MKKLLLCAAALTAVGVLSAQAPAPAPGRGMGMAKAPAASPAATETKTIAGKTITIEANGEGGNYALQSATGFSYYQLGRRVGFMCGGFSSPVGEVRSPAS